MAIPPGALPQIDGEPDGASPPDVPRELTASPRPGSAARAPVTDSGTPNRRSSSGPASPRQGPSRGRSSDPRSAHDDAPTEPILRISARLLLHIAKQPRYRPGDVVPATLTQAGMAEALGTTQAAVSNALNRLVDGGALRVEKSRVPNHWGRLKIYQLTDQGETLVGHIRAGMSGGAAVEAAIASRPEKD